MTTKRLNKGNDDLGLGLDVRPITEIKSLAVGGATVM